MSRYNPPALRATPLGRGDEIASNINCQLN